MTAWVGWMGLGANPGQQRPFEGVLILNGYETVNFNPFRATFMYT